MKPVTVLMALVFLIFSVNCSSNKKIASGKPERFRVLFGKTGGFTNINPVFIVNSHGDVLKKDSPTADSVKIKTISKIKTDSIYLLITRCNFGNLQINRVSNITNYIEVKSDKINNRVQWSDDSAVPPSLLELQRALLDAIRK